MLLKNCDVCGEEKKTELMCCKYTYTDELDDISITINIRHESDFDGLFLTLF